MKLNKKHAFVIIALGFLFSIPAVSALNTSSAVLAQDFNEDFLFDLIENGAEIVFTAIDGQGSPAVVYGQLGVPDDSLGLDDSMYDGCIVMALIATQGELIEYVLDLVGADLFNFDGGESNGTFFAQQFGVDMSSPDSVFDMLGTDFSLLINVFFDLTDAEAHENMASIRTHLHSEFEFNFDELLDLPITEELISSFSNETVTLPFTSANLFIYKVTNPFADAINSVLGVMDDSGFIQSIDSTVFSEARASGAGLLAVPDMGDLMSLIESFGGGDGNFTPSSFLLSQLPDLDGPLAIAAAGYIGDQVLSTNSDELNIFEDLLGKPGTGVVNGLDGGQSLVAAYIPDNMNLTSYSPVAVNQTYYSNESSIVFWNATAFSDVPDYTLSFTAGDFPPMVTVTREFGPLTTTPGGSTQVTVAVHNDGTEEIHNVTVSDIGIDTRYPASVSVSGTQTDTVTSLGPGEWLNITYTVTFDYEGIYAFDKAQLTYEYENSTYAKHTHVDGYTISADPLGLLQDLLSQEIFGYPIPLIMVGTVVLGAIVNIALMARGKGGGTYQV